MENINNKLEDKEELEYHEEPEKPVIVRVLGAAFGLFIIWGALTLLFHLLSIPTHFAVHFFN